ncbi:MAG: aminopeptidase P N-terminal domain-containing protein, partial [Treponema sp.]|nr:aminopeptidase P N-terminal domain-containing protein [Treponema sp.]
MENSFYTGNRQALLARLKSEQGPSDALAVVYSGEAPRKTNDEYYPFFTNRNFIYLTGIDQCDAGML